MSKFFQLTFFNKVNLYKPKVLPHLAAALLDEFGDVPEFDQLWTCMMAGRS